MIVSWYVHASPCDTTEHFLPCQLYAGRNLHVLLNVCQKMAECEQFVDDSVDLVRKIRSLYRYRLCYPTACHHPTCIVWISS